MHNNIMFVFDRFFIIIINDMRLHTNVNPVIFVQTVSPTLLCWGLAWVSFAIFIKSRN